MSAGQVADYDAYVQQLRAANVGEAAAHRAARLKYPDAAAARAEQDEQRANVLEKDEQREVSKLFRAFGFTVRNLSQARATKQAPGLFDLFCTHRHLPIAFWWDVKRSVGGKLSEGQVDFLADCKRCGVGAAYGDRYAARTHLITLGLAHVVGDALEPIRRDV